MEKYTEEDVANLLLWGLWRSIDEEYKIKYKRDIWQHFENAIKSASYTSSLKGFLSLFQRRIPCTIQAQYTNEILAIISSNQDSEILNWLRTESTYLIMLVRLDNQARKESFQTQKGVEA